VVTDKSQFLSGVIEGFYGQCWSWESREAYAKFLSDGGMNSYIYAPKSDSYLRKRWRQNWPDKEFQQLKKLSAVYRRAGLNFGLGLSPFELYRNFNNQSKAQLKSKLKRIESLEPAVLCILFDDMRGDLPDLAKHQIEICDFVASNISVDRLIMCPTYYSFDSVLEKVFGAMPANYWQELGEGLSSVWDVFWTGDKVVSKSYSVDSLATITRELSRKPLLWDNYPVNDGEKISNFLHLSSADRNAELKECSQGLLCNPMNQPELSKAAIFSTSMQLRGEEISQTDLYNNLFGEELAAMLIQDSNLFEYVGLLEMSVADKKRLKNRYKTLNHLGAKEVYDWLNNNYKFDSACLTD
jgi:hyaluronoglucosaminidase